MKEKKTAWGKFKTALIISHLSHGLYPMLSGQLKSPKHFWSVFFYFFFGSVSSSIEENLHIQ